MKVLFLVWQDAKSRSWYPVGRLTYENGLFHFVYTQGAEDAKNFKPFGGMRDFGKHYMSPELFPFFANRILRSNRPEYKQFLKWLNIGKDGNEADPLLVLSRSGGRSETDSLALFQCPEKDAEGVYETLFFAHGIRHLPTEVLRVVENLKYGTILFLMRDIQNKHDPHALALRTGEPIVAVGYCPRYHAVDFTDLLDNDSSAVEVFVEKVNNDAPTQLRMLCKIRASWPNSFEPCSSMPYQPIFQENYLTAV